MGAFDGHEAPTGLGSIYGYRYWYLVDGGLVAVSISDPSGKKAAWENGENIAACNSGKYRKELGDKPKKPEAPDWTAPASNFFEYAEQCRTEDGDYVFPSIGSSGQPIIPQFQNTKRLNAEEVDKQRQEYEEALAEYRYQYEQWEKLNREYRESLLEDHGPIPKLGCTCGFYMVRDPNYARKNHLTGNSQKLAVFGVVEGYGRIVVGEHGWRFEKARIRGLSFTLGAMQSQVRFKLHHGRVDRIHHTIDSFNAFSERYADVEFYKSDEELRAEWDERVTAS